MYSVPQTKVKQKGSSFKNELDYAKTKRAQQNFEEPCHSFTALFPIAWQMDMTKPTAGLRN